MSETSELHRYFLLRGALLRHQQLPWQLGEAQHAALVLDASREEQLVVRALASQQADAVVVEEAALQHAVESFLDSIASLGEAEPLLRAARLQRQSLTAAVGAELHAAAVLEELTATLAPSEQEVYQWFVNHPEQFVVPERREVFQILITVNEAFAENRRAVAQRRITELAHVVAAAPERFGELAQVHSECPTAVEAGRLGVVPAGQLYPELDRELFAMASGAISQVVESPLGFHLLRCGVIEPLRALSWDEAREPLTRRMAEHKRKRYLQQWLRGAS